MYGPAIQQQVPNYIQEMNLLDDLLGKEDTSKEAKKDSKPKQRLSLTGRRPTPSSSGSVPSSSETKRPNNSRDGPNAKRTPMFAPSGATGFVCNDLLDAQINLFEFDMSKVPAEMERLHVRIVVTSKSGKDIELTGEGMHGDLNEEYRRRGNWNAFKTVFKLRRDLFAVETNSLYAAAYDCFSSLYLPYGTFKGEDVEIIEFEKDQVDEERWSPIAKTIRAQIVKVSVLLQRNKEKGSGGKILMSKDHLHDISNRSEVIRFLEVLTSQETHTRHFYQFKNLTFNRSSDMVMRNQREEIDPKCQFDSKGMEIKTGFEKSVRMMMDNDVPKLFMSIDVRRSPFYKPMNVAKFVVLLYAQPGRRPDEVSIGNRTFNIRKDEVDPSAVMAVIDMMKRDSEGAIKRKLEPLRNIAMVPTHLDAEKNMIMFIEKFNFTPADKFVFQKRTEDGEKETSIYDYFLETYSYRLKYPELPLVVIKGSKGTRILPMEMLRIERGQRVKPENLPAVVQQEMTGKLSLLPANHVALYGTILSDALRVDESKYLKAFGVQIQKTPFVMTTKILPAPVLTFGEHRKYTPETGKSKNTQIFTKQCRKFLKPAKVKSLVLVNFDEAITEGAMNQFGAVFEKACREHGLEFEVPSRRWRIENISSVITEELERLMAKAKKDNVTCVLGVTKEKRPEVHDVLKLFETKYGQQTEQLSLQVVRKIMESTGGQTIDNVIRKFNLKCGGSNFTIAVPRSNRQGTVCNNEQQMNEKLFKNTMFIGFELSHAGSTCLFDQQHNVVCGTPSVVGVSFSLGDPVTFGGYPYLQMPREHSLQKLSKYFPKAVYSYYESTRSLPQTIVVYRSGLGEGDLRNIETIEVAEMRDCLRESQEFNRINNGKPYEPKLVVIVVLVNSNYRVFPTNIGHGNSFEQNVPSGTCIDHKLVGSHGYDEFLLVSQSALIGSVRPTKYAILVNEKALTKTEIVHMTYFLAFGHQVSAKPPGIPGILYAAENIAKRGRNNFSINQKLNKREKYFKNNTTDPDAPEIPDGDKIDELSDSLNMLNLKQKNFWA